MFAGEMYVDEPAEFHDKMAQIPLGGFHTIALMWISAIARYK